MGRHRAGIGPDTLGPPLLPIMDGLKGWVAVVLAVCDVTRVSHINILQTPGRVGTQVTDARRLLTWAFIEVADAETSVSTSWLEQFTGLTRRTVTGYIAGERPGALGETLECYTRLMVEMSQRDVWDAISAGLVGAPQNRSRRWPRGFHQRLGLRG